jgi:hypothetical protein
MRRIAYNTNFIVRDSTMSAPSVVLLLGVTTLLIVLGLEDNHHVRAVHEDAACFKAVRLRACSPMNGQMLFVDFDDREAALAALGIPDVYDSEESQTHGLLGAAVDAAIDRALADARNAHAVSQRCVEAARLFLCQRHFHPCSFSPIEEQEPFGVECQSSCRTYNVACSEGAEIDWPLSYNCASGVYSRACSCPFNWTTWANGYCRFVANDGDEDDATAAGFVASSTVLKK